MAEPLDPLLLAVLRGEREAIPADLLARRLDADVGGVRRQLRLLEAEGRVQRVRFGAGNLWALAGQRNGDDRVLLPPVFADEHHPLSAEQALQEANLCLRCGSPGAPAPCTLACPARVDVPGFIGAIAEDRLQDAAEIIFDANDLGATCARVCPVADLCEGACVLRDEGRRAVRVGLLQRSAADAALADPTWAPRRNGNGPAAPPGASVGIVGAGPAGLACAAELARLGYGVTVYEEAGAPGGLVTRAIAPYKTRVEPLPAEMARIEALGVTLRYGIRVGRDVSAAELRAHHDALFLGVGLGPDRTLGLPGEDLAGVWPSLELVEAVRDGRVGRLGGTVAIVGGGNTAIDVAREARHLGAEDVVVVYRRTEDQMPAYASEVEAARREGVRFRWLTVPTAILGDDAVTGLACAPVELGEPDASGRPTPQVRQDEPFVLAADVVVLAAGQEPRTDLATALRLVMDRGHVVVDEHGRTNMADVFAGGDCVHGGATVVEAVADGRRAAGAIHRSLASGAETPSEVPRPEARAERDDGILRYRVDGFAIGTAPDLCKGCDLCLESCPVEALALDDRDHIVVTDPAACVRCGLCEARCPDFAIWLEGVEA